MAAMTLPTGKVKAESMQVDRDSPYEYDLVVIGGGSGGLSCSKRAAELGAKVCVLDYVKPSPAGSTWGLGGTCVNVGCIPKKLMHQASEIGHFLEDAPSFGWELPEKPKFSWEKLVKGVQDHIGSLNWGYRVALRDKNVSYINAFGSFKDAHTLKTVNRRGKEQDITADKFVIAVGGRPRYPNIPGAEFGISSDDLFSLQKEPGKTLVVGASYVALECAGFLTGLGFEAVVMVRSILLRGFDQESADMIGAYMEKHGTRFIRHAIPTKIEKRESDGKLIVSYEANGEFSSEEFDTVLFAIGRDAVTKDLNLESAGVAVDSKTGKINADEFERTTAENIFAIGDVLLNKPELTPVAIHAGRLLAERLYGGSNEKTDYVNIPTTVFTPLEYGCCGLSEEDAIAQYGAENIEVYLQKFTPLEWTVPKQSDKRDENACFAKLICNKLDDERVLGFHYLGPNAGEVTQGFGIAFQLRATKKHFDTLIGIHPTTAETFTTLKVTRSSGENFASTGC